ncbi:methyltransferase domain-containing protein [Saccharomonospora sp. NPDC046836]|uniref:methyltransferase domain-containing protein n=1 Tax=Saccharomonospora sp. NPDC046836 TaxID=3156921 RepID=UPI003411BF87
MDLGFGGEVTDFYHRYRRGYPPAVIEHLMSAFELNDQDVVLDLGCGTGQLTLPLARRVRTTIGMDPEPDMLTRARVAAREQGVANTTWLLGGDSDLPSLEGLLGPGTLGAVTIAQALHWMDHDALFGGLAPLLRPGGGIAVVTNGRPLWLQDTGWSMALRDMLSRWLGTVVSRQCGTDEVSQRRYKESLTRAGFAVRTASVDYTGELALEHIVGGVYSALPRNRLPSPEQRPAFAELIREAVEPHRPFAEEVRVRLILATAGPQSLAGAPV